MVRTSIIPPLSCTGLLCHCGAPRPEPERHVTTTASDRASDQGMEENEAETFGKFRFIVSHSYGGATTISGIALTT